MILQHLKGNIKSVGWIYTDEVYLLHAFRDVVNKTKKFEQTVNKFKMQFVNYTYVNSKQHYPTNRTVGYFKSYMWLDVAKCLLPKSNNMH